MAKKAAKQVKIGKLFYSKLGSAHQKNSTEPISYLCIFNLLFLLLLAKKTLMLYMTFLLAGLGCGWWLGCGVVWLVDATSGCGWWVWSIESADFF